MDQQALMQLVQQIVNQPRKPDFTDLTMENVKRSRAGIPQGYVDPASLDELISSAGMVGAAKPVSKGFNYIAGLGNSGIKKYLDPERLKQLDRARDILKGKGATKSESNMAKEIIDELADFTTPRKVIDKFRQTTPISNDASYYNKIGDWIAKNIKESS